MNSRLISFTLVSCVVALTPVNAQPPGPRQSPSVNSQMCEDIEVLGRILDRALNLPRYTSLAVPIAIPQGGGFGGFGGGQGGFGGDGGQLLGVGGGQGGMGGTGLGLGGLGMGGLGAGGQGGFSGGGLHSTSMAPVSVPAYGKAQGTYIKGHGVIYTIVLPPSKHESKPTVPLLPTQSEWDRVRKQIRGENPPSSGSAPKPKEPSLADTVLEVLAKNGHHFSQLAESENLTVSIIFRDAEPLSRGGRLRTILDRMRLGGDRIDVNAIYPGELIESQNTPLSSELAEPSPAGDGQGAGEKKKPRAGTGGGGSGEKSSPDDYELLGDLHLKQGQGQEALRAYQQALAKSSDAQHAAALYLKLAQLYLTTQKDETEARQAMDRARELLTQAAPAADKSAPKPAPASGLAQPLPSRLIISVPKRLLDQVGAGKMTLEEFKKKANVERLSFSVPQK
jgi:tetratricopeptide (TPR) repeat protein